MEYGSVLNEILDRCEGQEPKVGMGATVLMWSDREPYTIIKVSKSKKTIWLQRDDAVRTDKKGMSEDQTYEYTPNPNGSIIRARKTVKGKWKVIGTKSTVLVGKREKYRDPTF